MDRTNKKMISFLAVGDLGDLTTEIAHRTMATIRSQPSVHGVLLLGDNFYPHGIESEDDPRWKEWEQTVLPSCPWYAVLGNHDYLGDPMAEVRFSSDPSRFWTMPGRYYDQKFMFPDGGGVHLICLDTFELSIEESRVNSLAMGMSSARFHQIITALNGQWEWLDQVLSENTGMWKVVIGHYPIYSSGNHGNNQELIHKLDPILKKHRVDLYLSGHDHHLEHRTKGETQYIVTGAGSYYQYPHHPIPFPGCGVASLVFFSTHAMIAFLDTQGHHCYHKTILPNHSHPLLLVK